MTDKNFPFSKRQSLDLSDMLAAKGARYIDSYLSTAVQSSV